MAAVVRLGALFALVLCAQKPLVERAWELLAQDKKAEAATLLRGAIRSNPGNGEAHLLLGSLLADAGETSEAIAHLSEGVRLRPKDAAAHHALGEALSDAGDLAAAGAEFRKAVALNARFAPAYEALGQVLLQTGDLPGAAQQLDRAIRLLGETEAAASPRYLRARVHTSAGETSEAEKQLRGAVTLRPDFAEAWSDLGQAREDLGDDAGALAALQRSVQINPDGGVAQTRLGSLYQRMGKPQEAVRHLQQAVRLLPDDHTALNGLQLALRDAGQTQQADEVKARLIANIRKRDRMSRDALSAVVLNNEGAELEKQGRLAAAAEKYRSAVDLNPDHAGIRVNYAVALLKLGRWEPGLRELRHAVQQDPSNQTFRKALDDALAQAPAAYRSPRQANRP